MAFIKRLYGEYTFAVIVLVLGLGLSMGSAWNWQRTLQERTLSEFRIAAQDRIELIDDKISHNNVVLRALAGFYRASEYVSREEFSTYSSQLLKDYTYIHTLEWIPHVKDAEREAYEKGAGYENFMFTQSGGGDMLVRAAQRGEYFPVYYAEPLSNGNEKILGFDITSDPDRYEALQRARDTRQPAATSRVHLIQIGKNADGVIFYEPVIKKVAGEGGKEYDHISGYIASVIPLEAMIDAAIKPLSYAPVNIVIHDLSAENEDTRLLYVRSTRMKQIPREEILNDFQNKGFLAEAKIIDVGGRKWQITILPARGYFPMTIHKSVCVILLGGLLFTCLLVVYMISRIRENERIAREVLERTEQLATAKRETEMILLSTHEGIMGLDRNGNIGFCNATAGQLLGYSKKDLIGQNHHALVHNRRPDGSPYDVETCPIHHILEYGSSCNVRDEVFWHRGGEPVQVEYTGSPIFEGGEVTGAVLVFRDIAERRALEKKLEQMARYDHLTTLANRTLFIEHLKNAIARAERTGKKVGVIYLDLNGFKPINDTLGHAAGDLMLKKFADCLKEIVRDADVPARMGGDEFTILADNLTKEEECLKLVERLQKRLEKPFEIGGQEFNIGASIGIAFFPDHAGSYEDLISCADTAMYQAKADKSLPLVIYSPGKKAANSR